MLFILAMEPLQLMLQKATDQGLLTPIKNRRAKLRISLFTDDAEIFLNPTNEEVQAVKNILCAFGNISGLITNTEKCVVYPVRCEELDLQHTMLPGYADTGTRYGDTPIRHFPKTRIRGYADIYKK